MHRDKKLGLALGVLLVGIVGAFFFRNEDGLLLTAPRLSDPSKLDDHISEGQMVPYLTGVETDLLDELDESPLAGNATAESSEPSIWDAPDFLKEPVDLDDEFLDQPFSQIATTPDPIREQTADNDRLTLDSIGMTNQRSTRKQLNPEHNQGWTATTQPARPSVQPIAQRNGTSARQIASSNQVTGNSRYHEVRSGETLSGIASRYLGSSRRYHEIYRANEDILANPDSLRVGMKLRIPEPGQTAQSNNWQQIQTRSRVSEQPTYSEPVQSSTKSLSAPRQSPGATLFFEESPAAETSTETVPISNTRQFIPVRRHPFAPRNTGVPIPQGPSSNRISTSPLSIKAPVKDVPSKESITADDLEWDDLNIDWSDDPFAENN